jgi:nicotinate-nucleotide adenylyltransferase
MTLAILGGTFDPVHCGHLHIGTEVQGRLGYERILFVPANIPVHKQSAPQVGPKHRLQMLRLALASHPRFSAEPCELERGGSSYTIDTVRYVLQHYPVEGKPGLIIGDDLARDFGSWKEAELLAHMVELVVVRRLSEQSPPMEYPCRYLENVRVRVSSSEVRARLRAGEDVSGMVPEAVLRYIRRHGLYA